jgi:hypothetical protein
VEGHNSCRILQETLTVTPVGNEDEIVDILFLAGQPLYELIDPTQQRQATTSIETISMGGEYSHELFT